ncbi:MAG: hypothetical protein M2R45_01922 [Verrucomicrobia subdivision 3 bacterium]|nr:hypothetical protein [Limisphaerales bacterium]MCS1416211.1 hypothetical protein [Limisphaerales bacterium]
MALKLQDMRIGMRVRHPQVGIGVVRSLGENVAEIRFDEGMRRISPEASDLESAEEVATISTEGQSDTLVPVDQVVRDTVEAVLTRLGVEFDSGAVEGLASRWKRGKLVIRSGDPNLQPKEVELETFFHKIVMMRNNLRTLEQKLNSNTLLSEGDKFELQQYITRCYGSMTTFNVLFKDKDDHFRSKA